MMRGLLLTVLFCSLAGLVHASLGDNTYASGNNFPNTLEGDYINDFPYGWWNNANFPQAWYTGAGNTVGNDNNFTSPFQLGGFYFYQNYQPYYSPGNNYIGDNNDIGPYTALLYDNEIGDGNNMRSGIAYYNNLIGDYNNFLGFYIGYYWNGYLGGGNQVGSWNDVIASYLCCYNHIGDHNQIMLSYLNYGTNMTDGNTVIGSALNGYNYIGDDNVFTNAYVHNYNQIDSDNVFSGAALYDYDYIGSGNQFVNSVSNNVTVQDNNVLNNFGSALSNTVGSGNVVSPSGALVLLAENSVGDNNIINGVLVAASGNTVGDGNLIDGALSLKENCTIGSENVFLGNVQASVLVTGDRTTWKGETTVYGPVRVGDDSLIGRNTVLMDVVDIGECAIVCDNTVVPSNTLVPDLGVYGCSCAEAIPCQRVDDNHYRMGGHHYTLVQGRFDYPAAVAEAARRGGHLATVQSWEENECIRELLVSEGVTDKRASLLGLVRGASSANWEWRETGEDVLFTNWDFWEPNNQNPGEDCTVVYGDGGWNDEDCVGRKVSYDAIIEWIEPFELHACHDEHTQHCPVTGARCFFTQYVDGAGPNDQGRRIRYAENQYFVVNEKMTWSQAQAYAQSMGGYLATIHTNWEMQSLVNLLEGRSVNSFWIGLYQPDPLSSTWEWVSEETVCWEIPWDSDEPNDNIGENCAVLYSGGGVNDLECDQKHQFIVELGTPKGDQLCPGCNDASPFPLSDTSLLLQQTL